MSEKIIKEAKEIIIGRMFTDDNGETTPHKSISVTNDEDMIDPDEKVIEDDDITINFDYPLSHTVKKDFQSDDGFTRHELWQAIHDGYTKIYDEEDTAVGDPGTIGENSLSTSSASKMINRSESQGPHGIWGHYIGDLFIEGVVEKAISEYDLTMGS